MPVIKNEYPILEYDTEKVGVILPNRNGRAVLPKLCLMTFFREVLADFIAKNPVVEVSSYNSEMGVFPIYKTVYRGFEIGLVQAVVGSASAAMMIRTNYLFHFRQKRRVAVFA